MFRKTVYFLFAAFFGCLLYGFFVEPNWIEVTHHEVAAAVPRRIRIAHLTDLHVRSVRPREEKLLRLLDAEKPDLIVVTGDSVSDNENYEPVDEVLSRLHAPLGTWVIQGNWERWHPRPKSRPAIDRGDLRFLDNAGREILPGVALVGFIDGLNGLAQSPPLPKWKAGTYRIALLHSPADFDRVAPDFDLVFAGHSHGGQIRMPFLPPLYLPYGCGPYVEGWYARGDSRMYVSRGIGNSGIEARFLARPELAIVDLVPR